MPWISGRRMAAINERLARLEDRLSKAQEEGQRVADNLRGRDSTQERKLDALLAHLELRCDPTAEQPAGFKVMKRHDPMLMFMAYGGSGGSGGAGGGSGTTLSMNTGKPAPKRSRK